MNIIKPIFILVLIFIGLEGSNAQIYIPKSADSINQFDAQKRKTGFWKLENTRSRDDLFQYTEYGNYINDRKDGIWTKLDGFGRIKSVETYFKGILDGKAMYYDQGRLYLESYFKALDPDKVVDSFMVYNPDTELEELVIVPTEKGSLKHGDWKYYDPITSKLLKIEIYQVDSLIRTKNLYVDGLSTEDPKFKEKHEQNMPHKSDPTGRKFQKGKVRKSLIK